MIPIRTSVEIDEVPAAVLALLFANVAMFLVLVGLPEAPRDIFIETYALVPERYSASAALGPGNILRLVTNSFLHAGWFHLIVNMWTLWLFGRPLEQAIGTARFLLFYLACGAAASLAHLVFNLGSPIPVVGASGAIAGVLGGFTLIHPRARIMLLAPVLFFPVIFQWRAAWYTAFWIAIQIVQGVVDTASEGPGAGIAWWAHVGGFLAGLALIRFAAARRRGARTIGVRRAAQLEFGGQRERVIRVGTTRRRDQGLGRPRSSGTVPARRTAREPKRQSSQTPERAESTPPQPSGLQRVLLADDASIAATLRQHSEIALPPDVEPQRTTAVPVTHGRFEPGDPPIEEANLDAALADFNRAYRQRRK